MRTIKFRGQHLCGQWYYGNLIVRETDSPVPETPQAYKCVMIGDVEDGSAEEVEEETIGQFTCLFDKNGKEIYEGDVIKCGLRLYVCEFIEGGFEFRDLSDGNLVLKAIVNNSCIIGNIHDNPELLKRE